MLSRCFHRFFVRFLSLHRDPNDLGLMQDYYEKIVSGDSDVSELWRAVDGEVLNS